MKATVLSVLSLLFAAAAGFVVYGGIAMDTTVAADTSVYTTGRVANLQMMQLQMINIQLGLALGIIAAILFAAAFVVAAVEARAAE